MDEILSYYRDSQQVAELNQWLVGKDENILHLGRLAGSSPAVIAACMLGNGKNHVFILPDKESAAYFHNDLFNFSGREDIQFFPSSYKRSVQYTQKSADNVVQRTGVLKKLSQDAAGQIIITFPEALVEKTVSGNFLEENAFSVNVSWLNSLTAASFWKWTMSMNRDSFPFVEASLMFSLFRQKTHSE